MSVIGTSTIRTDGVSKVTGSANYVGDLEFKGMLHAAILRSPVPAGIIKRLDLTVARSMPGVIAVISAGSVPDVRAGWMIQDTPLFASDEVRYEGEPVAAVAARSIAQARRAVAAIELAIDEIEPVATMSDALRDTTRQIHPDLERYQIAPGLEIRRGANIATHYEHETKNFKRAFDSAASIVEDEFDHNRQYQGYLEPKAAVAIYDAGRYHIHAGHQYVFNVRDRVAQFLDVPVHAVKVEGHTVGGGFGGKLDYGPEPFAAVLSRACGGKPVRLVYSREEDMLVATCRENAHITIRSALNGQGEVIAREFLCDHDNGAYSGEMPFMAGFALSIGGANYRVGEAHIRFRLIHTNTAPTGAYRGVSAVPMYNALEQHMDHIALTLEEDRRALRLRLLLAPGDKLLNGQTLNDAAILRDAFAQVENVAPWIKINNDKAPLEGIGIAACTWLTNPMPAAVTVRLAEDGSAAVTVGTSDIGTGAVTQGVTQIVADALCLSPDAVTVSQPDTDFAAYDGGSQGSRTSRAVGSAALNAAVEVRNKLLDAAAPLLEADAADLFLEDGFVRQRNRPGTEVSVSAVLGMCAFTQGALVATGRHGEASIEVDPARAAGLALGALPTITYHVHLAHVRVDPVTGRVAVLRYVVAQDVGKAINPDAIRSQIQGGVAQGIGYSLQESLRIEGARYVERNLESYRLPLAVDIPDVESIILEYPAPDGAYGIKGAAEPSIIIVPAVIGNAVADALGVRIHEIPITPEAVLKALDKRRAAA